MSDSPTPYAVRIKQGQANLWPGEKPKLGQLDIELTERCNNNCIHCCVNLPANDRAARAREMTTAQVKAILDQAAKLGAMKVRFTGGEPLLRPDFEELYLYARRLGLKVLLFTNGRLITPHLADLWARVPPLVTIEITVYGMHAGSYEAVSRVAGSFAQFWHGVDLLLARGVPFVVKGALLPPNRHEIDEFEAWARDVVGMVQDPPFALFLDLRGRRDSEEKNRQIEALRLSPEEGLAVLTRDPARYRRSMHEFCTRFMRAPGDCLFSCGAGRNGCVDAYGQLQPCLSLRDPSLAVDVVGAGPCADSVGADPCTDPVGAGPCACPEKGDHAGSPLRWALTEVFPRMREMRATAPEYLARCARCFLKGLCEQCPAKSWAEHGTLDTPVEYVCQVAHAQARYLGLLDEGERAWEVADGPERVARMRAT